MTDGDPVAVTAARLTALGLDHVVFDAASTHADLAQRIEMSASLDVLVTTGGDCDPTAFDPRWPAGASLGACGT